MGRKLSFVDHKPAYRKQALCAHIGQQRFSYIFVNIKSKGLFVIEQKFYQFYKNESDIFVSVIFTTAFAEIYNSLKVVYI